MIDIEIFNVGYQLKMQNIHKEFIKINEKKKEENNCGKMAGGGGSLAYLNEDPRLTTRVLLRGSFLTW